MHQFPVCFVQHTGGNTVGTSDVRPGLVSQSVARRYQNEAKHRATNVANRQQNKPRQQLETEQRDEGLKSAITADNKGFKLLEKMGYKPGTGIGKKGTGAVEPIPLSVKTCREGLGQESERRRKAAEQRAMRVAMARKRQRHEAEWRENVRSKVASREIDKDLAQSQNVCEQLDSQLGVEEPQRKYFWPAALLRYNEDDDDDDDEAEADEDDVLTPADKLAAITEYLRSTHCYCVWCGTAFNDASDMKSNCPGDTSDVH